MLRLNSIEVIYSDVILVLKGVSLEVAPGIVLDLDEAGSLVGIDIDHASQQVDLWGKGQTSVPVEVVTARSGPA